MTKTPSNGYIEVITSWAFCSVVDFQVNYMLYWRYHFWNEILIKCFFIEWKHAPTHTHICNLDFLFIEERCSQRHNMEFKKIVIRWCLHHITHYESKKLLSSNDVCWCWKLKLVHLIHKDCMFTTSTTKTLEKCSIVKFVTNWAYSWGWGS